MKQLALILLLSSLIFGGCIKNSENAAKNYQIPWQNSNHEYSLQNVYIESFEEPQFLRGIYAEFFIEPELVFDQGRLGQPGTPSGRFSSNSQGSSVALDTMSMQAVAIYAHLEQLEKLNVSSGANVYQTRRLSVGIDVGIETDHKKVDNNAQYNPDVDALLFVPYTDSGLPITFNAGVIGHEYFHSIFQHIVLAGISKTVSYMSGNIDEPINTKPPQNFLGHKIIAPISMQQYNRFVLRGINEGMADFWGWLYSGDETFVGRSLSNSLEARRLDRESIQFYSVDYLKAVLSSDPDDQIRLARSYSLGSQYAVYFHNITLKIFNGKSDAETRAKMAKILILALPKFKEELVAKLETEFLAPEIFIKSFVTALQESSDAPNLKGLDFCSSIRDVAPESVATSQPISCAKNRLDEK